MASYNDLANDQEIFRLRSAAQSSRQEADSVRAWAESVVLRLFNQEARLYSEIHLRRSLERLLAELFSSSAVAKGFELAHVEKGKIEAYIARELKRVAGPALDVPPDSFYEALIRRTVFDWPAPTILSVKNIQAALDKESVAFEESKRRVISLGQDVQLLQQDAQQLQKELRARDETIADLRAKLARTSAELEAQKRELSLTKHSVTGTKMFLAEHRWKLVRNAAQASVLERELRLVDPGSPILAGGTLERVGAAAELQFKREHSATLHIMFDADVVADSARKFGAAFKLAPAPVSREVLSVLDRIDGKQAAAPARPAASVANGGPQALAVAPVRAGASSDEGGDAADEPHADVAGDAADHSDAQGASHTPSDNDEVELSGQQLAGESEAEG